MISVGVDVSKGKSTVCILKPYGEIVCCPFEVLHMEKELDALDALLNKLNGEIRIVMEATGIYHLPVLTFLHEKGYFVSVINPYAMKKYAKDNSIRGARTDKLDSIMIANYGIEKWFKLKRYAGDEEIYAELKLLGPGVEALIIAYGDGRNGKSTFWNAISRVLGLYSGNISADTLTVGCRRNIKPEMAEVKGKRLLIAAEMQEGARLNDSTVKQLCSTDDVFAEKKYKDPFSFKPCHTLVLYTNHLPRVSASDDGIWRRLIVIPFNAKIEGKADIKNYGEYLYENAGESILAWIIEGAKKVIALDYQIPVPDCVTKAINEYRSQNDWFGHFLDEKCDVDESFKESSSALYQAYRNYSLDCNEYVRSTADFYFALEKAGFERLTLNRKRYFKGLKIHEVGDAEEDFLQ